MHIAVLDDDRGVRESLTFLLEVAGHEVSEFASAADLLQRCDFEHVAGLIVDQHMPGLTGLEVVGRLRSDRWRFPILLITAGPSPAIVARAAELGIEKVLTKPFDESEIMTFLGGLSE